MKNVYICAPLGGNVTENVEKVKTYAKYAFECGMAPVIPHFYALILDDSVKEERELAIQAGISLLFRCDEIWVFGNRLTEGMFKEIKFAKYLKIKIRYVSDNEIRMIQQTKNGGNLNE